VKAGKIRYYGVSNYPEWQVCEMEWMTSKNRMDAPMVYEGVYNLLARGAEDGLIPFLCRYQMGFTVYNPLAGGMLTGKYTDEKSQEARGRLDENPGYRERYFSRKNLDAVLRLQSAAQRQGMSLVEFSYRWILSHKEVSSVIMGFSSLNQLKQNLDLMDSGRELAPDAETERLVDEVWKELRGDWFRYYR